MLNRLSHSGAPDSLTFLPLPQPLHFINTQCKFYLPDNLKYIFSSSLLFLMPSFRTQVILFYNKCQISNTVYKTFLHLAHLSCVCLFSLFLQSVNLIIDIDLYENMLIHDSLPLLSCGFLCLECPPSTADLENSKVHLSKFHSDVSFSRKLFLTCLIPVRVNHFIFLGYFVFFPIAILILL